MYIRWKKYRLGERARSHTWHGPDGPTTKPCRHAGLRWTLTPILVDSLREQDKPRQRIVDRPGFSIRSCCVDDPVAVAAFWLDVSDWLRDVAERLSNADDFPWASDVLRLRARIEEQLAAVVRRPTASDWRAYEDWLELRKRSRQTGSADHRALHRADADAAAVLGLSAGFTRDELKSAYRRHAKLAHPDAGGSGAEFIRIKSAYDRLARNAVS